MITVLSLLLMGFSSTSLAQNTADEMPSRLIVIGDLHADLTAARAAFTLGGAIDNNDNWIGGDLVVVQLGAKTELRWVDEKAYPAFEDIPDFDLENARLEKVAELHRARAAALMSGGHYAKQLADFPVVLRLGDTIFVHDGGTPYWAKYGIDRINSEAAVGSQVKRSNQSVPLASTLAIAMISS